MPNLLKRKPTRLKDYDYSQKGAYFITICTDKMEHTLGEIRRGDPCGCPSIALTQLGEICEKTLHTIANKYNITLDKYVIMPNHIHFVYFLDRERATARVAPTISLIVGGYKSLICYEWLKICKKNDAIMGKVFQRSFYDHIIRNEQDYLRIWEYIENNPLQWELDRFYNE